MPRIRERYLDLQALCPDHELLKYFYMKDGEFCLNSSPNNQVVEEFRERFGSKRPTISDPKIKSFEEYRRNLCLAVFGDYLSALEKAVQSMVSSS